MLVATAIATVVGCCYCCWLLVVVDVDVDVVVVVDVDVDNHVVQVMSGANRRDWTPAFPDDHRHDGMKRDSRYYYPRNHLL